MPFISPADSHHFKLFAQSLQRVIAGYNDPDDKNDFTAKQKKQVETLVKSEREFKRILLKDSRGHLVYRRFIRFIVDERRNILAARPYFRERQGEFSQGISLAIKENKFKKLYKFDINYPFIAFSLKSVKWGPRSRITMAAKSVYLARREIIELNMPLAISQARIFRYASNSAFSHLNYFDLVQISFEGLINAVDKFVLPYTTVFRSVIIGRVKGDLIESASETSLHFYPSDKRKIYRANKAQKGKMRDNINYDNLSEDVNTNGPGLPVPTNAAEIQQLLTASGTVSINAPVTDQDGNEVSLSDKISIDKSHQPDIIVEDNDVYNKLHESIQKLSLLDQKVLAMRGIELDD